MYRSLEMLFWLDVVAFGRDDSNLQALRPWNVDVEASDNVAMVKCCTNETQRWEWHVVDGPECIAGPCTAEFISVVVVLSVDDSKTWMARSNVIVAVRPSPLWKESSAATFMSVMLLLLTNGSDILLLWLATLIWFLSLIMESDANWSIISSIVSSP